MHILASLGGGKSGVSPEGSLVDAGALLYGTTAGGGR